MIYEDLWFILITCRSSHRRYSIKKVVLKNFAKSTGKHLCQSLFFNKVAGVRCFPVNFAKLLGTHLRNTSWRLLLDLHLINPDGSKLGDGGGWGGEGGRVVGISSREEYLWQVFINPISIGREFYSRV